MPRVRRRRFFRPAPPAVPTAAPPDLTRPGTPPAAIYGLGRDIRLPLRTRAALGRGAACVTRRRASSPAAVPVIRPSRRPPG